MKQRICTTLKVHAEDGEPCINLWGRGETTARLSSTGEHQRILKLKDKDNVELIIRKVKP